MSSVLFRVGEFEVSLKLVTSLPGTGVLPVRQSGDHDEDRQRRQEDDVEIG
jgi:hypothetical protein